MNTEEEILELLRANPGVDLAKIKESLKVPQAQGRRRKGYDLASPLDIHKFKMRKVKPDKTVRLSPRHP